MNKHSVDEQSMSVAKEKVLVAMSGGVDSSVAAGLLVEAGYDVTGVTLKLWGGESDSGCCSVSDVDDARRVAYRLGIDHHVFNFGDDFNTHVVDPFVDGYAEGRVPNPCIECNRHIKFAKLLRRADALGFDTIATGHHAKVVDQDDGTIRLGRGADEAKDQSYVLHMLTQAELGRLLLPVGEMTKTRVRELAVEMGFDTAAKPDSQDVCFIHSDGGRSKFLGDRISLTPGTLVDAGGEQVGTVTAVELITIGQRKGLGFGGNTERRYVTDINHDTGVVTVGSRADTDRPEVEVSGITWSDRPVEGPVMAQWSAHGARRLGRFVPTDSGSGRLVWDEPQIMVSRGQSVVFYDGDLVLGGGIAQ